MDLKDAHFQDCAQERAIDAYRMSDESGHVVSFPEQDHIRNSTHCTCGGLLMTEISLARQEARAAREVSQHLLREIDRLKAASASYDPGVLETAAPLPPTAISVTGTHEAEVVITGDSMLPALRDASGLPNGVAGLNPVNDVVNVYDERACAACGHRQVHHIRNGGACLGGNNSGCGCLAYTAPPTLMG